METIAVKESPKGNFTVKINWENLNSRNYLALVETIKQKVWSCMIIVYNMNKKPYVINNFIKSE